MCVCVCVCVCVHACLCARNNIFTKLMSNTRKINHNYDLVNTIYPILTNNAFAKN